MAIYVDSIRFTDDFTGLPSGAGADTGLPFLMGCVGDFIYVNVDFHVEWSVKDANMTFDATAGTIKLDSCSTAPRFDVPGFSQLFVRATGSGNFIDSGFRVGDTIVVEGTTGAVDDGTYTITKVTTDTITVAETIASDGAFAGVSVYGVTQVNALDFYYNMVGNNDAVTYLSQTDTKAMQRFTGINNPYYYGATHTLQPNSTSKAWWNDKVDGVDSLPLVTDLGFSSDHKQMFSVQFPFLITPFATAAQIPMLISSLDQSSSTKLNSAGFDVPSYFMDQCLRFVYQIDARFSVVGTAPDHSTKGNVEFENGNTSWFNTFFPTGVSLGGNFLNEAQYELVSISYADAVTNAPLDVLNLNAPTKVSLTVKHVGGGSMASSPFVLNFMQLPQDQGMYQSYSQGNQADFREVFLHDRCKTTEGSAPANGDMYGTQTQALKSVTATALGGGQMQVDFTVDLGSLSKSTFRRQPLPTGFGLRPSTTEYQRYGGYMFWIAIQGPSVTTLEESDRTAVIADINSGFIDDDDPTLLTINTNGTTDILYYKYPDTYANPHTNWEGFEGEYGLMRAQFRIKSGCVLNSLTAQFMVQIYDSVTGEVLNETPVETWAQNTSSFFDGRVNQIQINQTRGFLLPATDLRNTRSINRYKPLDNAAGTYFGYELVYGFQVGYQWWQNLTDYDPMFERYHTQYWPVYTQGYVGQLTPSGAKGPRVRAVADIQSRRYRLVQKVTWDVLDPATGHVTQFIRYAGISAHDSGANPAETTVQMSTSDQYGNDLGGQFSSDGPTTVVAVFQGAMLAPRPGQIDVIGTLAVSYNNGTASLYDQITTLDTTRETTVSLWEAPAILVANTNYSVVQVIGTVDFSGLQVKDVRAFATLTYQTDDGLVTDAQVPIITDGGDRIVVDK